RSLQHSCACLYNFFHHTHLQFSAKQVLSRNCVTDVLIVSTSWLALWCQCNLTVFDHRSPEYCSPAGFSASTAPSVYKMRTSPWRRSILALSYSESGSKPSTGPPLSKGLGSRPAGISSGGLWPAVVFSKAHNWRQSLP